MVKNNPKTVAKLLRAIANASRAKEEKQDVIFNVAADMIDPPRVDGVEPLFYVKRNKIFQRPVRRGSVGVSMGFDVCTVSSGVDPNTVCEILNKGEAPPADEPADD